jgi:endonuclease YncB( thermonuclease family)
MKALRALAAALLLAVLLAGAGCIDRSPLGDLLSSKDGPEPLEVSVCGLVTKVVDGDTFDVEGLGRVRLADVDAPEMDAPAGKAAKFFAEAWLLGEIVHLDVDDLGVKDRYGRWIAVAYIEDPDTGSLVNFNYLLVSSGHAVVKDFKDNKFDPGDWGPAPVTR